MQRDIADPPATTELQTEALAPGPAHPNGELPPPRGRWSPRRALLLEGLIVYVVLQLLTYPFLPAVRDRGQAFYNDVLLGFFGPEKHGLARILRSGILPAWVNDQYGGEPFVANLQHAVFYPGNLPFWLLKTSLAIAVVCAFHVAFAGLGMWAYSRFALRTSRWGAALAGLAFGFGSVTLQHIILMNQLEVIAWMPVVLLFGHLALERRQLRWVLLTGVAVGMQLLAGHPEEWVYTLLTLAIYGAGWVLVANPRQWPRRALDAALRLGGALVAFALLFAWQLLPTLLLRRYGYRTDPTFSQQFPLPKALAFNALLPDFGHVLIGENVAFIGVVALALAGLGIAAGPRRLLWARSVMLFLAVLGILAALVGAVGWAAANFRIVPRVLIALLLIGVTAVELRQARPGAEYHEMVPDVVYDDPGPIMERLGQEGGRYVTIAFDKPGTAQQRASIAIPPGLTPTERNYYVVTWPRRLAARPAWEYATGAETILGRDGGLMPLRSYQQFFNTAVDPPGRLGGGLTLQAPSKWSWPALDFLGVRWFVTPIPLKASEAQVLRQHGFQDVERQAFFTLWERLPPPMARMVYQTDVVPSEADRLARLEAGYPLLDRAMVDQPVGSLHQPTTSPVVDVTDRAYSKVDVSVRTATDGVLVLPDPYYPQWHVTVDGKPAKLLEVDHAFRGVAVPAGSHQVRFTYQDRAMQVGAILTLLTCLGLLGGWLWLRRRDQGEPGHDGEPGGEPAATASE